ncbi:MAG: DNA-processing protein DprA [Motiliproteus sp.]|nr:DNA-processing protein DprA [Motiliproteus sp.]MCW9052447.1 DNA-processing protein DprA [Motiliproteus sp.]
MSISTLSRQEAWLYLQAGPDLGDTTLNRLFNHFGSAVGILSAGAMELAKLGLKPKSINHIVTAGRQVDLIHQQMADIQNWLNIHQGILISRECTLYPQRLSEIYDPPCLLYVLGDPELLSLPQIAIVGSRNPTIYGLELAQGFSRQLSLSGYIPTSGLAMGIDSAAHRGAIDGMNLTIAVLGTGVDNIYPKRNKGLANKILQSGGCIVSEYSLGEPARAANFPRRNRIISGLSLATLVVEAAPGSGSLITAKQALAQGRDVFAIPGSIHNPMSKGCHQLIRYGAKLVEEVDHIFEELAPQIDLTQQTELLSSEIGGKIADLSQSERELMELVGFESTTVDTLISRSNQPADSVLSTLTELELKEMVTSVGGGYQRLR